MIADYLKAGRDYCDWYNRAHSWLQDNCQDPGQVADILAITSANCHVSRNVTLARKALAGDYSGMLPNVATSLKRYWQSGEISGRKTRPFAQALRGNTDALVLDRHMAFAFNVPQTKLFRRNIYYGIYCDIAKLAKRNRLSIAECQAGIWAGALLAQNRTPQYYPLERLFDDTE